MQHCMPVERSVTPDPRIVAIVDSQINRYAEEIADGTLHIGDGIWRQSPKVGGYVILRSLTQLCRAEYVEMPPERVYMRFMEETSNPDSILNNYLNTFFKDVAGVVGAPFPGGGNEDKRPVAEAALSAIDFWRENERLLAATTTK